MHAAEHAILHKPEWPKGWARKAAALEAIGKLPEALLAAQRALSLELGNAEYRALALSLQSTIALHKSQSKSQNNQTRDRKAPTACAFLREDPPEGKGDNLLVLLHGLGDKPGRYLEFGKRLQLPSTTVVALQGSRPLGCGGALEGQVEGFEWMQAFEDDGELIKPSRADTRRLEGLRTSADAGNIR